MTIFRPNGVLRPQFRSSQRMSMTLPYAVMEDLLEVAKNQGRSASNLAAFLVEKGLASLSAADRAPS
jgi:hypothetical protein